MKQQQQQCCFPLRIQGLDGWTIWCVKPCSLQSMLQLIYCAEIYNVIFISSFKMWHVYNATKPSLPLAPVPSAAIPEQPSCLIRLQTLYVQGAS